ncbi:MAG: DUF1850 domain-containing protein [Selenomonadaceae bacterium]|nr:DUF1850 domain-containing protein [Selenomonadaceae bacterium]
MRKIFAAIILILTALIFFKLTEEKIYISAEIEHNTENIASVDAKKGTPLAISFVHSVQKTPVIEELEFDGENFVLLRTKYKSQGVGLPFLESDGVFYEDGGWFIMDEMNRSIKKLELRTGVGTQLTINLAGQEFKLYEKFPAGTKIIIEVR